MAQPIKFPESWTEPDLDDLPDDGHRYEIVDGSLLVTPPPGGDHQTIAANAAFLLRSVAPKGWRVVQEVGVRAPGSNFIPDVVVLRPDSKRGNVWFDESDVALVVEVASPSTETTDRGIKEIKYAQARIPDYWRVARDGTVTMLSLSDGSYVVTATLLPGEVIQVRTPFDVEVSAASLTEGL